MDYSATYLSGQISAAEKIASAVAALDLRPVDLARVNAAIVDLYPTAHVADDVIPVLISEDGAALSYIRTFRALEPAQVTLDGLNRQEAEILAKYDISTLEDIALAVADQPVLVFTGGWLSAQEVLGELAGRDVTTASINPYQNNANREQAVADFQEGRARALVTTFAAGSVGWSVSNGARVMFYGEGVINASPSAAFQAKGRVRG